MLPDVHVKWHSLLCKAHFSRVSLEMKQTKESDIMTWRKYRREMLTYLTFLFHLRKKDSSIADKSSWREGKRSSIIITYLLYRLTIKWGGRGSSWLNNHLRDAKDLILLQDKNPRSFKGDWKREDGNDLEFHCHVCLQLTDTESGEEREEALFAVKEMFTAKRGYKSLGYI